MATELINRYPDQISQVNLHAGTDGAFEVSIDGTQVYSKLATKRYPDLSDIVQPIRERVEATVPA